MPPILQRLFPASFDNAYPGHPLGLWCFGLVLFMKTAIALGTIFNGRQAAQRADGIPLDSFDTSAAEAVVRMFALWGLAQLVLSLFGVLAYMRYRAMIPFVLALFLVEHIARRWILLVRPIVQDGPPPGLYINAGLLIVMILGLVLSLWGRADLSSQH